VASKLAKLSSSVVFTGGTVVGLLVTDSASPDVRPTDDVDLIIDIAKYAEYAFLQEELRKLGFKHDADGPNCRLTLDGLKVDVMPSDGSILGFTNSYYDFAMRTATEHLLPDTTPVFGIEINNRKQYQGALRYPCLSQTG
jgi:hypothetical protein